MRVFKMIAILIITTLAQSAAHAGPNVAAFEITGCRAWSESEQVRIVGIYWIQGYVSGHDFTADPHRRSVRMVLPDSVRTSIGKFCTANPEKNILLAAQNFVEELSGK